MTFINDKEIYLGISEKKDGPMKYSPENRLLFFKNKNLENKIIISAGLVHKNKVVIVDNINKNEIVADCDALITNQNKYLLTVTVSDCLPIYFYDKNKGVVAIAHAGWRGVVSEIAKEVINKFINYYNSDPTDIEVFVGPHIKDCHFEVKEDVANQFKTSNYITKNQKTYLNLSKAVNDQLIESGVPIDNIKTSDECTYCSSDKYFSHRRDKNTEIQAMIAYIGLK
jgi:YfiH family protein